MVPCVVGNDVFIGFNAVVFNCEIGDKCVIRHNAVVDGCNLPEGIHVPPTMNVEAGFDINSLPSVEGALSSFSTSVVKANHYLVKGYKALNGES